MISPDTVELSRLQFAITAIYHFLFVPLTLGLSFLLVIMEAAFVFTGDALYRDMVKFWGKLFGINFALGVATGITLEFQFGTNWAYYSHYVGDIFGAPLAIEGLMAFFLESTFIGLFFFGWDRLSRGKHLLVTVLMAVGSNLSALWILVANAWMQAPVGARFDPRTMRMELSDFGAVLGSPVAQAKFVHTVTSGYVTGAVFVLGVSAYYLLRGRELAIARRSFRIAATFGLAASLAVIVLGDESAYTVGSAQEAKLAAMEALWETQPAPAALKLFAIPDERARVNRRVVELPFALGLMGRRSTSAVIPGLNDIVARNAERIESGRFAVIALERLRERPDDSSAQAEFDAHQADLGYGLLLKKQTDDLASATPEMVRRAAAESVPRVTPMFWSFRLMVGIGVLLFALLALSVIAAHRPDLERRRGLLRFATWSIPLPWIAAELGWFVAEYGRQPWSIHGVLPTHLSVSSRTPESLYGSLAGFVIFYSILFFVETFLLVRTVRRGPSGVLAPEAPVAEAR